MNSSADVNRGKKVGVILLPALFGTSLSFWWHCFMLCVRGYSVAAVDIYCGQKVKRPFFGKVVSGGKTESERKIDALAASLDENVVVHNLDAVYRMLRGGAQCTHVVILGYGIGGTFALKWLENKPLGHVSGIIANFPHLKYPAGFPADRVPPVMGTVYVPCHFIFGAHDTVTPESREEAVRLAGIKGVDIHTTLYNAGHAFTDACVQGAFPNPFYRPLAAWKVWRDTLKIIENLTSP